MRAQQIAQDYYLFFDRTGQRYVSIEYSGLEVRGGELDLDRFTGSLEAELEDVNGKSLGKTVIVKKEENKGEQGVEMSFPMPDRIEIKLSTEVFDFIDIYTELKAPVPNGDGVLRIVYNPQA